MAYKTASGVEGKNNKRHNARTRRVTRWYINILLFSFVQTQTPHKKKEMRYYYGSVILSYCSSMHINK